MIRQAHESWAHGYRGIPILVLCATGTLITTVGIGCDNFSLGKYADPKSEVSVGITAEISPGYRQDMEISCPSPAYIGSNSPNNGYIIKLLFVSICLFADQQSLEYRNR